MPNVVIEGFELRTGFRLADIALQSMHDLGFKKNEAIVTVTELILPVKGNCVILHGCESAEGINSGIERVNYIERTPVLWVNSHTMTLDGEHAPYVSIHAKTMPKIRALESHILDHWGPVDVEKYLINDCARPCMVPHLKVVSTRGSIVKNLAAMLRSNIPKHPIRYDTIGFTSCVM